MFSFYFPVFPSGSFFSTFNASLIWLSFISLIILFSTINQQTMIVLGINYNHANTSACILEMEK